MKIRNRKTKAERIITAEQWKKITENGFAQEYEILEQSKPTKEVEAAVKAKAANAETPENK